MRDLLERLCREQMQNEALQMTDLSARISFLSSKTGLSVYEQNRLHTFRLTSNAILNKQKEPLEEEMLRDAKTLSFFVKRISGEDIPEELYRMLPPADATYIISPPPSKHTKRMRVCFQYADGDYLYVIPVDTVSDELIRVRCHVSQVNEEFVDTGELLWRHAQLNLLDVTEEEDGTLTPAFIVLEPDYLIDVSSLAECFKDYGHHPANYQLNKLQVIENTRALLLGNIANLFLDEWIHASGEVDYRLCMQKAFRRYPIELAACADLRDGGKEMQFFEDCKRHFNHIRKTVQEIFNIPGYKLNKEDAVLEPSYICEALGLQGRLDYMQRDMSSFIEMKSGKADEFTLRNKVEPKENNRVQMYLYQAMLQYSMDVDHHQVNAYLLYTRYPLLYPARSSWAMVRRIINLRNRIVADEYGIQLRNSIEYTSRKLAAINAGTLNERNLSGKFWEQYLRPSIDQIPNKLAKLDATARAYFFSLYNFITKEQYTAKSGDADYEGRAGTAALWLSTLAEKREAGEILYDLKIEENRTTDEHKPYIRLAKTNPQTDHPDQVSESLPNFRQGDAVVLYERNSNSDNVTNKMVFKGNIEDITEAKIMIRLRAAQQNQLVLPATSLYAVEHDAMDTTFRNMFQGLALFLTANEERRDLLLSIRPPQIDESYIRQIDQADDDLTRVVLKAQAAQDYFLLVGPPGTGKTSQALRKMVEAFSRKPDEKQILLLAYTNRAVDEICKALLNITPRMDFIRIGNELSCDPCYREYLMENVLQDCTRRPEVIRCIASCRIFVGTVATLSNKPEIFRLKTFDVAIIDEASQILEPQLVGILSARNERGDNSIGKFILIGDHKQLPAVVLQRAEQTGVYDESLRSVGITNFKDSLFERLYRSLRSDPHSAYLYDRLCKQGRMHPGVARFSNQFFYNGELQTLGLPHQLKPDTDAVPARTVFFPSRAEKDGSSAKINRSEAVIAANLAFRVYSLLSDDFDPSRSLGIITSYRNQIALIKKELSRFDIPILNKIVVDTVERFQGSERDVIIYSFSVNHAYQLKQLSNLINEDGVLIDRKLNVVLTRAREQMFITGVPELLSLNPIYSNLIKLMNESIFI